MFKSNQSGTSQKQAPVGHRELNPVYSRKTHLEGILVEVRRRYSRDTDPAHAETAIPLVRVLGDLVKICTDPAHAKTVIPLVRVLRDLVKVCDELINYQGQDQDRIQSYKAQKKLLEEALTKIVPTQKQNLSLADSKTKQLEKAFEISKGHYTCDSDPKCQQTAIPLVRALRDLAEAYGDSENYKKQKEILETALAISRKDADHKEIAKLWCSKSDYSLKGLNKEKDLDKDGVDHIEDAKTLHKLGNAYYNLNDYAKAKKCYEKALDINERISPIGDVEVADILNNLGSIDHALGDYQKAKKSFEEALPIFKKLNNDIRVAAVSNNLGNVYRDLANREEAKKFFTDALSIYKKVHHPEHIKIGVMSNELGNIYYSLAGLQKENDANEAKESYEKAKDLHESALHIYEKFYDFNHVQVAELLDRLGNDYNALKEPQKAKESYAKELAIYEAKLSKERFQRCGGPDDIKSSETLRNLGNTYFKLNDFEKSMDFYEKELKIRKEYYYSYTTDSYAIEMGYNSVTREILNSPYNYEASEKLRADYQKRKELLKVEVAKTLNNVCDTHYASGNHQKAKELLKTILEKYPNKSITAKTLEKLKDINESLIEQLEETVAEKKVDYPSNHLQIGQALKDLGYAYGELKDYPNQKKSLEEALPILKEYLGNTNSTIQKALEGLRDAYNGLGDTQKAQQIHEEAEVIKSEYQQIALAVKNRNKPNSTLDSTSAQAAASKGNVSLGLG